MSAKNTVIIDDPVEAKSPKKTARKKLTKRKPVDKVFSTTTYWNKPLLNLIDKCGEKNIPVLLLWETGTGKTTMVRTVAEKHKRQLVRLNMNWQTGREEFVWKYTLIGGEMVRQDWPLVNAMRNWYWLLVDEINVALPEILFVMQSILEVQDGKLWKLFLSEKDGEVVEPHENFRVFATANPADSGYVWTKDLNQATMSRFIVIDCPTLKPQIERILLKERFHTVDEVEIFWLVNMATNLRDFHNSNHINYFCSTRDLVNICSLIEVGITKKEAIKCCIYDKVLWKNNKNKVGKVIEDAMKISYWEMHTIMSEIDNLVKVKEENETLKIEVSDMKTGLADERRKSKRYKEKAEAHDELKHKLDEMMNIYQDKIQT